LSVAEITRTTSIPPQFMENKTDLFNFLDRLASLLLIKSELTENPQNLT